MQTVTVAMMQESIWFDRLKFEQDLEHYQMFVHNNLPTLNAVAEAPAKQEQTKQEPKKKEQKSEEPKSDEPKQQKPKKTEAKVETKQDSTETSTLTGEIEKARRAIEDTLSGLSHSVSGHSTGGKDGMDVSSRVDELESENRALRELLNKLTLRVEGLEARLGEAGGETCQSAPKIVAKEEPKKVKEEEEDDDDFDMFGDDEEEEEETEEEQKIREEKLANYHAKKAGKKAVIAKSSLLIDVKPWDNETDMKQLEACVRTIEVDGLIWGGAKLIPVAYGVFKCQITAVIEDAKVDTEELQDQIKAFEEFVQSTDIAGFNKI